MNVRIAAILGTSALALALGVGLVAVAQVAPPVQSPIVSMHPFAPLVTQVRIDTDKKIGGERHHRDPFDLSYTVAVDSDEATSASSTPAPTFASNTTSVTGPAQGPGSVFTGARPGGQPDLSPGANSPTSGSFGNGVSVATDGGSKLKLTGIAIFGSGAAATIDDGSGSHAYRLGESVGGKRIIQIRRDHVVLENGESLFISLTDTPVLPSPQPSTSAPPAAASTTMPGAVSDPSAQGGTASGVSVPANTPNRPFYRPQPVLAPQGATEPPPYGKPL